MTLNRLLVALTLVSLLFACSNPSPPAPPPDPATSTAVATSTPAAAAPAPQPVKSSVAVFDGTLPCADCAGIDTHLVLQRDELDRNSYTLRQIYQNEKPSKPFNSAGTWRMEIRNSNGLALIHIDSGRPGAGKTFRIQEDGSLLMTSPSGEPAASDLDYSLERRSGDLNLASLYSEQLSTRPAASPATP